MDLSVFYSKERIFKIDFFCHLNVNQTINRIKY